MKPYKRLPSDPDDHNNTSPGASEDSVHNVSSLRGAVRSTKGRILCTITLLAIMIMTGIAGAIIDHREAVLKSCACGSSIAEALTLGCEYDTLASAWLPQHCIDKELTEEFSQSGDGPNGSWQYWADHDHRVELMLDEVAALADVPDAVVYMSAEWHVKHCLFYWRKQVRQRVTGVTIEPRFDTEAHIKHCGLTIQRPGTKSKAGVVLNSD